jgi:glycosyltransferase involved in cell wall biosynthesis
VYAEAQSQHESGAAVELRHVLAAYEACTGFDIVHDHTLLGPFCAGPNLETPIITTIHGPFDPELRAAYRAISQHVPVIAISRSQASAAGDVPIAGVIRHGIDAARFPFTAEPGRHLLFLGRMSPQKGVHRAVEVARLAGEPLVIAAKMQSPQEQRYFAESVEPMLTDEIRYVGEVTWSEKLELLSTARALLNPIRWPEPFGLVMIEALACGTPVLAFPNGAAPEIVRHGTTGFLCRDEEDMVAHLSKVSELDRAACRASVTEWFSVDRMVTEHLTLFETLLGCQTAAA